MRAATILLASVLLIPGCKQTSTTETTTDATTTREKTTAEKAFDAGQGARKKAEAIKAEEDRKAKETDAAANP